MTTTTIEKPSLAGVFDCDEDLSFAAKNRGRLTTHLQEAGPEAWVWCVRCERAFQLGDVLSRLGRVVCAYADCDGVPLDFWRWDAYCAFMDTATAPAVGARYPLHTAIS
jgi:hypothetical protein